MSSLKSQIRKFYSFDYKYICYSSGGFMAFIMALVFTYSFADFGILKLKGEVRYCPAHVAAKNKVQLVKVSDTIKDGTCLQSNDGYIVLKQNSNIILAKGSFEVNVSDKKPVVTTGKVRFKLKQVKDFRLQTRNAVAGVRGTDFFVSYNPDLGETEVICFESKITLSDLDGKNLKEIPAGFWGGKGGRFGASITNPIQLNSNFLSAVKADLAF